MRTKKPISVESAFAKAAALCSRCEQAESDIRRKLSDWGISQNDADNIIQKLIDHRFLDEVRFASAFTRDKFRFEGWGRIKISYNLKMKHISSHIIEEALALIDEEEYTATLKRILSTKMRTLTAKEPLQAKASLVRFAASRGFEPNLIYKYLPDFPDSDDYESQEYC